MWENLISFIIGAAVPVGIYYLNKTEKRKKFELQRKDKYKLVAVEKRLETHQEAFYHWGQLKSIVHSENTEERDEILSKAIDFWYSKNLYLEKATRENFSKVVFLVRNYKELLEMWREQEPGEDKEKFSNDIKKKLG